MEKNGGRAFHSASSELLAEVIFGYEQYGSQGVNALSYADAIKHAIASSITITSEWQPITVQTMPGLGATKSSVKFKDAAVEVIIVVSGN
ncbi:MULTISPECIES: hypothetical protein [Rhizobium]|uniref:hypothetical protein n=1 Tax=Rhizobium TaxID=379 RepID=UPI0011998B2A|nr:MULTISPECIES: hypothetical protein [Rhizobium]MDK4722905.1 hypothetical protein [Rhizobium sp. CNPSo 3968]